MVNFKGSQFEREILLWAVRWYVAYPISSRQLEEMMGERGVAVHQHYLYNTTHHSGRCGALPI